MSRAKLVVEGFASKRHLQADSFPLWKGIFPKTALTFYPIEQQLHPSPEIQSEPPPPVICGLLRNSAYEVKNNCGLFERLFKVKKSGVFLFGISFFVFEIFTFLYYANEESDDVINSSTKTIKYWIKNISRNIRAVIFKPGTRYVHHKRNKMTPTILLPWQHPWFQSLSVKNQISSFQPFWVGQGVFLGTDMVVLNSPH